MLCMDDHICSSQYLHKGWYYDYSSHFTGEETEANLVGRPNSNILIHNSYDCVYNHGACPFPIEGSPNIHQSFIISLQWSVQYWNNTFFFFFFCLWALSGWVLYKECLPPPSLPLAILVCLGTLIFQAFTTETSGFFSTPPPLERNNLSFWLSPTVYPAVFSSLPSSHFQSLARTHPLFSLLNPPTSWLCRPLSPGLNNPLTTLCLHPHPPSNLFWTTQSSRQIFQKHTNCDACFTFQRLPPTPNPYT